MSVLIRQEETLYEAYCENGGEETPETIDLTAAKEATRELIQTDGIDMLGRRRIYLEDKLKMLKAEKAAADRKIKAAQQSIDFINSMILDAMKLTGVEKVKGLYYGFTAYVSEHTSVDMDELNERWQGIAEKGAREMGLPGYIDVELKTSVTKIQDWAPTHDGQGVAFLETATADAVRFTKPRAGKDA